MISSPLSISPDKKAFTNAYEQGTPQLLWTRLVSDLESPVSFMLKLMQRGEPSFLLESVLGGEARGRYSIIGLQPDLIWRCHGNRAEINRKGNWDEDSFEPCWEDGISSLRSLIAESKLDIPEPLPPMAAGLIGYMGYDMVKLMERLPHANDDEIGIPDSCFMRPGLLVIVDSVDGVAYLVVPVYPGSRKDSAEQAYLSACERIEATIDRLQGPIDQRHYYTDQPHAPLEFKRHMEKADYLRMVERAKEYIAAGDIFQVVLSQRFSAPFTLPPFSLYRALRYLNPSPFLFHLNIGPFSLIGSSPEILVRLRDGKVTIRPIAGTRRRGRNRAEDTSLAEDLLSDEKELAEHLMLLDLGRNDVGRVAKPNSVKVTEQMIIEHYSHVMHIVSNVEGELDDKHDAMDALIGGFPAGTVSGAPKIRAMEIIDELEPSTRSFYAGCVGYFSANGSMDTCINLRTGLVKDGTLYVQAGGGIVADSSAEAEYEESWNKAQALMRAAEFAGKFV